MALRDANGVPVLALGDSSLEDVQERHQAALDPEDETMLLIGEIVYIHNKRPVGSPSTPDVATFTIGAETLDEALKSVIGAFELHAHLEAPDWVASSNEHLAKYLAEHYACKIKDLPTTRELRP